MKIKDYNAYSILLERKEELEEQLAAIDSRYRGRDKIIDHGLFQLISEKSSYRQTVLDNHEHMNKVAILIKNLINEELENVIKKMDEL